MTDPMTGLWRAQQDAATRMTEGWRALLQPSADRAAGPPAPPEAADPPQQPVDTDPADDTAGDTPAEVSEPEPSVLDAFQAIQALSDGQRDFAQHMARWAELQRDLADTMASWASRQRDYADSLDRTLAPFSPGTDERRT